MLSGFRYTAPAFDVDKSKETTVSDKENNSPDQKQDMRSAFKLPSGA
jgi:hypothetical protein